jgi:hypothetical protein
VSVLFRQPHGFEGFRLAHVELLVDDQPVPERIGPRHLPEGHLVSALVSNPFWQELYRRPTHGASPQKQAPDQCSCSWRRAGMLVSLAALSRMSTLAAFPKWKGER